METSLINCDKRKTFYIYHILCVQDVIEDSIRILKSLVYQYAFNLEIIFYNMNCIVLFLNNNR